MNKIEKVSTIVARCLSAIHIEKEADERHIGNHNGLVWPRVYLIQGEA